MPKMKSRKGATKRFKVAGSGRLNETKQTIDICLYVGQTKLSARCDRPVFYQMPIEKLLKLYWVSKIIMETNYA